MVKITMMQQRSAKQCSSVDSRRRLTDFKNMMFSQSINGLLSIAA